MSGFTFAPDPPPRGHSYFEGLPEEFTRYRPSSKPPSDIYDALTSPLAQAVLDKALDSKSARQATLFVQRGVGRVYHSSPAAKVFINKVASTSLGRSVHGAAAISHVSKIVRTHGISTAGTLMVNNGRLLYRYTQGEVDRAEVLEGFLSEAIGMGGDMTGWMVAGSIAGAFACPPWGAVALGMVGSTLGRAAFQRICRAVRS
jgi:hypothetical protein